MSPLLGSAGLCSVPSQRASSAGLFTDPKAPSIPSPPLWLCPPIHIPLSNTLCTLFIRFCMESKPPEHKFPVHLTWYPSSQNHAECNLDTTKKLLPDFCYISQQRSEEMAGKTGSHLSLSSITLWKCEFFTLWIFQHFAGNITASTIFQATNNYTTFEGPIPSMSHIGKEKVNTTR